MVGFSGNERKLGEAALSGVSACIELAAVGSLYLRWADVAHVRAWCGSCVERVRVLTTA